MYGAPEAMRGKDRTISHLSPSVGYSHSRVKTQAETYLRQYAQECGSSRSLQDRLAHIQAEIDHTGTY